MEKVEKYIQKMQNIINTANGENCIQFKRVSPNFEKTYINVTNALKGCWAFYGWPGEKEQPVLSLGKGCVGQGVIFHEFMHALGFAHEHQRPDRDKYIEILKENIPDSKDTEQIFDNKFL